MESQYFLVDLFSGTGVVVDVEVAECENNFEILAHKEHKKRESLSSLVSLEVSVGNIGTEEDT